MRGETFNCSASSFSTLFQSTLLMRGETMRHACGRLTTRISIHSPHARGDHRHRRLVAEQHKFQSTPLTRGETFAFLKRRLTAIEFQSTPLIRGETLVDGSRRNLPRRFQSTPLIRGETLVIVHQHAHIFISIHSPHARGDGMHSPISIIWRHFNPLPSCEGRHVSSVRDTSRSHFNPLPSCEGRQFSPPMITLWRYFNPLPSCEGRPHAVVYTPH